MSSHNNGLDGSSQSEEKNDNLPSSNAPRPEPELPRWATKSASTTPFSDARMIAFIGPKWETYYRRKLARFIADPAFTPTWNWAAALGYPFWFLYRKLYLAFFAFMCLGLFVMPALFPTLDAKALQAMADGKAVPEAVVMFVGVSISVFIVAGGTANWLIFRRARAATMIVAMQQLPEESALAWLKRNAGLNVRQTVLFVFLVTVLPIVLESLGLLAQ